MLLYLVRHGIAEDRSEGKKDEKRRLTEEGIEKTREAARGLAALKAAPSVILSSPLVRAAETARIFAEALGIPPKKILSTDALAPGAEPPLLLEKIEELNAEEVLCVGHASHLDDVVSFVAGSPNNITALKKAGVVCLELERISPPKGTIKWLLTPRILRKIGE